MGESTSFCSNSSSSPRHNQWNALHVKVNSKSHIKASQKDKKYEEKKPINCGVCEKSFDENCELNSHIAIVHEGKKPFQCSICEETFAKNSEPNSHTAAVHVGKKSFMCDLCHKKFSNIDCLNKHNATVHKGENPLNCMKLKVIAVNVEGLHNKYLHVSNLLSKYKCSLAVLSEVETSQSIASSSHIEGFRAFCPPKTVTGPKDKEVGVLNLVANDLVSSAIPRPDINCQDSVQIIY